MRLKRNRFSTRARVAAVAFALAAPAFGNPNAPTVVNGQATFQVNGKTLTVTNTPGAIINWQGFSIAADELTRFLQQSSVSAVLNRVVSANPSEILGRLQSNGRVFLVNPNGILFGPNSQVDVAAFAASTLNISNADFISGRLAFSGTGAEGKIVNQGEIVTPAGGKVYLIGPQVENSGIIRAPSGEIVLAAGSTVRLVDASFPSIQVEVSAEGKDLPLGNLANATTGRVFAFVVRQSGVVSASAASVGDGGKIVLKSAGDVQVAAGSRIEATGASGGTVAVQAAELVAFSGAIDVRGIAAGAGSATIEARQIVAFSGTIDARGMAGSGGAVQVQAREFIAFTGSIDARGLGARGGDVVVEAPRVLVAYSGTIDVSGASGGGRVALIAEQARFAGTFIARAERSGDGGTVEVSGRQTLAFTGTVDTRAVAGKAGTLLIDPARINVIAGSTGMPAALADGIWAANEDPGTQTVGATELTNLLRTTSVTLQATESVTVAAGAVIEAGAPGRALTIQAPRVLFEGTIRTAQAPVDLTIQATSAQVTQAASLELGGGRLNVAAQTVMVAPAEDTQRLASAEAPKRAATVTPPEVSRLRAEVLAEIERDNARLAEAMSQSCAKAGAPRQGCTIGATPKRFAFAG